MLQIPNPNEARMGAKMEEVERRKQKGDDLTKQAFAQYLEAFNLGGRTESLALLPELSHLGSAMDEEALDSSFELANIKPQKQRILRKRITKLKGVDRSM